jgi:precorrin-6B methylase 2
MHDTALATLLDYHARMLRDRVHVAAYRDALMALVRPGSVVIDLGAGTGILACFACQAGARKVYAIERGRVAQLARQLVASNGFSDRITVVEGESSSVSLPERADLLVTETLWNFGIGAGMLASVADARARLLVEGARIVPSRVELWVAPAELPAFEQRTAIWNSGYFGLDLSTARSAVFGALHPEQAEGDGVLGQPCLLATVDLTGTFDTKGNVGGDVRSSIERGGKMHGLLGWFRATLGPGIQMSNEPSHPCSRWHQALLPLDPPLFVVPGDVVSARVDAVGDGSVWRWAVEHLRGQAVLARRKHSTLESFARFGAGAPAQRAATQF